MVTENGPSQLESEATDHDAKNEVMFENMLALADAAAYLEAIALSLRSGSIHMRQGDTDLTLTPSPKVSVEIRAARKKKKEGFSLELSWSLPHSDKLVIS